MTKTGRFGIVWDLSWKVLTICVIYVQTFWSTRTSTLYQRCQYWMLWFWRFFFHRRLRVRQQINVIGTEVFAFEMWCWRKILGILRRERRTGDVLLNELDVEWELMAKVAWLKQFGKWYVKVRDDLCWLFEGKRWRGSLKTAVIEQCRRLGASISLFKMDAICAH